MTEKIQRLSEGMDFIEEECGLSEGLTFEETSEVMISESKSHKSPFKIIGAVKGIIQPIGELSRNQRLYPETFWPEILNTPEIQERLASRDMLGCISHTDKKVDCADLKSGEVSHIVTKLEVRENEEGRPFLYGEMEILDTPAGRIIKALYEGGANIYVSTRGAGKLVDVPGKPYREVLSSQYWLETIDFVRRPGFVKAHPTFEAIEEPTQAPQLSEAQIDESTNMEKVFHVDSQAAKAQNRKAQNEDLATLKLQVEQLAQIMEKVVDSIYEQPSEVEQPVEESTEVQPNKAESLAECISLLAEQGLSEEAFEEVLETIKKGMN